MISIENNMTQEMQKFYSKLEEIIPGSDNSNSESTIYLTRVSMDGLGDFHEYSTSDPKFYKYLEYETFSTLDDSKDYLERLLAIEEGVENRTNISWFIRLKENDKVIGTARLVNIDYHRQSVSWGYGISPKLWGKGVVFEIQKILAEYIFETLLLNRLHGVARIDNLLTVSTLKAFGFKEEGVQREAMRDFNGVYYNTWLYSMIKNEYFSTKDLDVTTSKESGNKNIVSSAEVDLVIKGLSQDEFEMNDEFLLQDIPGWDSLVQMQLISSLEEMCNIEISMKDILSMATIGAVREVVVNSSISSEIC